MRVGGIGGGSSMPRATRSTMQRRTGGQTVQAPAKHSMNLQPEPRRPAVPRSYRKGLMA